MFSLVFVCLLAGLRKTHLIVTHFGGMLAHAMAWTNEETIRFWW